MQTTKPVNKLPQPDVVKFAASWNKHLIPAWIRTMERKAREEQERRA